MKTAFYVVFSLALASCVGAAPSAAGTESDAAAAADVAVGVSSGGMTSPTCMDGLYTETTALSSGDLAAEVAAFSATDGVAFVSAVLAKRYPNGKFIMESGDVASKASTPGCIKLFWSPAQGKTAQGALGQAGLLVHECGHMYDLALAGGTYTSNTYFVHEDLEFKCTGLSYTGANAGFARSLIKGDEFNAAWPACANFGEQNCDGYAPLYLNGEPKDEKFDSGDQGYNMVIEEVNQYVNSLATGYAVADQLPYNSSAEDGILTYFWYMQRYLHMARLQYPDAYKYLIGNSCWRQVTLTLWGRGWFYLNKSADNAKLNLKGAMLRDLVKTPALLDEIARIRQAEGCK